MEKGIQFLTRRKAGGAGSRALPIAGAGPRLGLVVLALALTLSVSAPGYGAGCDDLDSMVAKYRQVYPTGGPVEVIGGETGRLVMDRMLLDSPGRKIAFLYSGDGPVTGARGRYLYLVLDERDCIRDQDWIDGKIYDRVTSGD
jgi:hypothetical protein